MAVAVLSTFASVSNTAYYHPNRRAPVQNYLTITALDFIFNAAAYR